VHSICHYSESSALSSWAVAASVVGDGCPFAWVAEVFVNAYWFMFLFTKWAVACVTTDTNTNTATTT